GDVTVIYVDDRRSANFQNEGGVRLVSGNVLPTKGLTVATPDPIYVKGNYNVSDNLGHTSSGSDTTYAKPASLIGDAITILSATWSDDNSTSNLASRPAENITVNAAFLAGIVETTSGQFSGGMENFPRFLEDWTGDTFTFNGSMVVLYPSQYATGLWQGTGSAIGIYNPPIRQWNFDRNFLDPTKLPAGTPMVGVLAPAN